MKIMVSACLAGENCKYNGGNNRNEKVLQLMEENEVITVCPEVVFLLRVCRQKSDTVWSQRRMAGSWTWNSVPAPADTLVGEFDFSAEKVLLNSGWEMPIIGTGTWTLSDEEAENSTYYALKAGMRLIDTARYYQNETGVGKGLARAIDEGIVTREEVFITGKIYGGDHDRAVKVIDEALSDLNVDYIDLMLIHQPGSDDAGVYKAMEEAVERGKIHSIGISNYYTKEQVEEVLSFAEITPAVIQNENHIFYQNAELRDYVKQYGIVMESWYPFGGRGHTQESFENDVILDIAKDHGKTAAQIILRGEL